MPSVLNVDTIVAANGTDPVTLTKQQAAIVNGSADSVNATLDSGFNVSSLTDNGAGDMTFNITNATSSITDRVCHVSGWNTNDDGTNGVGGAGRGFLSHAIFANNFTTSTIRTGTGYGSLANSPSNGAAADCNAAWLTVFGDLA